MADDPGFLTRWARRKASLRDADAAVTVAAKPTRPTARLTRPPSTPSSTPTVEAPMPPVSAPAALLDRALQHPDPAAVHAVSSPVPPEAAVPPERETDVALQKPTPPTLADVAQLTHDADFSRFVATDVASDVRNAALKKLFTDPHFNVMDGLDTYIGDYNTPDPLPEGWLRRMVQSEGLGLFSGEEDEGVDAGEPACASRSGDNIEMVRDADAGADPHPDTDFDGGEGASARVHAGADRDVDTSAGTGPDSDNAPPLPAFEPNAVPHRAAVALPVLVSHSPADDRSPVGEPPDAAAAATAGPPCPSDTGPR